MYLGLDKLNLIKDLKEDIRQIIDSILSILGDPAKAYIYKVIVCAAFQRTYTIFCRCRMIIIFNPPCT